MSVAGWTRSTTPRSPGGAFLARLPVIVPVNLARKRLAPPAGEVDAARPVARPPPYPAGVRAATRPRRRAPRILARMADTISFARGAPSLDIVDVEGLREAAQAAFENDPAGTTAYGTSVGYVPLREYIAERARRRGGAGPRHQRLDAGRRVPVRDARLAGRRRRAGVARPTTARCSTCAAAARTSTWSSSRPTASTSTRSRPSCATGCARSSRTSSPTSRTRPATR